MARPTFKIDQKRLSALRKERGYTCLQLGTEVGKRLGTANAQSDKTLENSYQRIEVTGNTSQKRALALASILNVSVEQLQGLEDPEPFDYLQKITALLKSQLENKKNKALQHAMAERGEDRNEDALHQIAQDIGERIEAVQLGHNPSEIDELIALTGLSKSELLSHANVLGHWFVRVTSRGFNRSNIVHGVTDACFHIKEIVGDRLDHFGSDNTIRLLRDDNWFRLEISRPRFRPDLMRVDFVRCRADAKGLYWSPPSWQDEFWIKELLTEWAYSAANFVTDLDGKQSPCDLQRLRLLVTEHEGSYDKSLRQMVISGHLNEIPDSTKEGSQREGQIHSLFISRLVADLRQALLHYLSEYPTKCWRISSVGCVDIHFTPPKPNLNVIPGVRYQIRLVEEVEPNLFAPTPWRKKDKEKLRQKIEDWLHEPYEPADADDSMPRFEQI